MPAHTKMLSIAEPVSSTIASSTRTAVATPATISASGGNNSNSNDARRVQQLDAHPHHQMRHDYKQQQQQQQTLDHHSKYGSQEEDALMNEMISKHRTEMTELHKLITCTVNTDDENDDLLFPSDTSDVPDTPPPPPPPLSNGGSGYHDESYDELPSPDGYHTPRPVRSKTAERLLELSRTEEALRPDRMRLAELSDVRNERIGREVISRWNPQAKVVQAREHQSVNRAGGRQRSPRSRTALAPGTASPRTSAKILGYSKDFVQQALDFNGHDMDDSDVNDTVERRTLSDGQLPRTRGLDTSRTFVTGAAEDADADNFRGHTSQLELRTYVKQMEETIAQLVEQKDELLRNQVEFDKHASGIFPSLEHLNHQLSQIVQGKMASSQVNVKDDVYDEIRIQGEKLEELESETKRRHHDADVLEQNRVIEITQIKGQIVSLVTSSKLRDEKTELIADSVAKLEVELQEAVKSIVQRYQHVETRLNQLQTPRAQPRFVTRKSHPSAIAIAAATAAAFAVLALALMVATGIGRGNCGLFTRCSPLT